MATAAACAGAAAAAPAAASALLSARGPPPKGAPCAAVHLVLLHHGLFGSADHLDALQAHLIEHLQARRDGRAAIPGTAPLPPLTDAASAAAASAANAASADAAANAVLVLNCTASEGRATIDGIDVCGERLADLAVDAARALAGPRGGAALASLPARAAVFPVSASAAAADADTNALLTPTNSLCPALSPDLLLRLLPPGSRVTRLSLVGYSMGGLVARYAAGLLYARGFFARPASGGGGSGGQEEEGFALASEDLEDEEEDQVEEDDELATTKGAAGANKQQQRPRSARHRRRGGWGGVRAGALVAIATPNLGSFRPPGAAAYFNELFNTAVPWVASRTGHQLMLLDADLCAPARRVGGGAGGNGNDNGGGGALADSDAFLGGWPAWLLSAAWSALLSQLPSLSSSSSSSSSSQARRRFRDAAVPAQLSLPPTALGAPAPPAKNSGSDDDDNWAPSPPLLALMAAPRHAFWRALALFERRGLVANIRWDASVPYCTAAIALRNPFRGGDRSLHEPVDAAMPTLVRFRGSGVGSSNNGTGNNNSSNNADGLGLPDDSAPGQSGMLLLKAAGGEVEEEGGQPRPYQGLRALILALILAIPLALPALAVAALRGARHHRAAALARAGGALAAAKERAAQAAAAAAAAASPASAPSAPPKPPSPAPANKQLQKQQQPQANGNGGKQPPPQPITKAAPPREGMAWALRRRYDHAPLFASVARGSGGATGALVASRLLFNTRHRHRPPYSPPGTPPRRQLGGGGGGVTKRKVGGGGLSMLSPWAAAAATVAAAGQENSSRPPTTAPGSIASGVSMSSAWPSEASSSASEDDDDDDALSMGSSSSGDGDDDEAGAAAAAARLAAKEARERARRERRRARELRAARRLLRRWRGPWAPEAQEFRRQRGLRAPLPALEGDVAPVSADGGGFAAASAADVSAAQPPLTPPGTAAPRRPPPPGGRRAGGLFRLGVVGAAPAHRVALERVCSLGGGEPSGYASPAPVGGAASAAAAGAGGGLLLAVGGASAAADFPEALDPATAEFERAADAAAAEAEAAVAAAAAAGDGAAALSAPAAAKAPPPPAPPLAPAPSAALAASASAALLAQQLAQQLPVLLSPAQQRARRRRRAQDAAERLHAAQRWMAARLRALKWERADVCAYHYQAHASIVLRDQRFFGMPRDTLEFAARQVFGV